MAIDTQAKRIAAINPGLPWQPLPPADSEIDRADRASLTYMWLAFDVFVGDVTITGAGVGDTTIAGTYIGDTTTSGSGVGNTTIGAKQI